MSSGGKVGRWAAWESPGPGRQGGAAEAGRTGPGPAAGRGAGGPLISQRMACSASPRLGWLLAGRVRRRHDPGDCARFQVEEFARQLQLHVGRQPWGGRLAKGSPAGPQGQPRGLGCPGFSACLCRSWGWGGRVGGAGITWTEGVRGSCASAHRSERGTRCAGGRPFSAVSVGEGHLSGETRLAIGAPSHEKG